MGKIMNFPKYEVEHYQNGLKSYNSGNYYEAYQSFLKTFSTFSGKTIKAKSIKYIVECLIELKQYDKVYKIIENEFVDQNVDEDFLIQKYIFTMYLEGKYDQVLEIISIYTKSKQVSRELEIFFDELVQVIELKIGSLKKSIDDLSFKEWLTSNDFSMQMKIVTNIEQLNIKKYKPEILGFLRKRDVDSQIRYILLKFLMENDETPYYYYKNKFGTEYKIKRTDFIDLYESELFLQPINAVRKNISNQYPQGEHYLKNIWITYCLDHYPNLISKQNLASAILHYMLYKSMNLEFNINDLCKLYNIHSDELNLKLFL